MNDEDLLRLIYEQEQATNELLTNISSILLWSAASLFFLIGVAIVISFFIGKAASK